MGLLIWYIPGSTYLVAVLVPSRKIIVFAREVYSS